ncbi:GGDEF domain-containing protein [Aliidiomarina celeris]|uniref:GGDEF domain-containing protein n=1 Tax=Aliidiomarina celeris TaxID=2249428 RepID=UPI000DE926AD|nr:diguanylate cyclase [Aliidiomarina celeris]
MDIITIIVLTGITNLTFALYSWQQVRNPESHSACKFWAQAHFIKAISFVIYAVALSNGSNDLRLLANILILLGCWAEVRAYIKLSAGSIKTSYLFIGFVVSSAVFTFMHVNSAPGPNNTMIITASFLLVVPLFMNVIALYSLSKQHQGSVFPVVLFVVNATITLLCLVRGTAAMDNPYYIITQTFFTNQLFMFTTFISGLGNGIGFIGFLKERSDAKLQQRANFDYLTGVHNRQHFESLAERELRSGRSFALYFFDLDKFKSVNDRFGHATGDDILRVFGQLLGKIENKHNAIAGRLGGEEFGLILPHNTSPDHNVILARLRTTFAEQAHLIMGEPLTFSCGVCATQKGTTIQNLMREADTLLYQAKRDLQSAQS